MTDEKLAEIEARANAVRKPDGFGTTFFRWMTKGAHPALFRDGDSVAYLEDAAMRDFVFEAFNDVPVLVSEVRRLRAELAAVKADNALAKDARSLLLEEMERLRKKADAQHSARWVVEDDNSNMREALRTVRESVAQVINAPDIRAASQAICRCIDAALRGES